MKELINYEKDIDLKNYSSMHVGGKCKFFFAPNTQKQLKSGVGFAKKYNIPYFILGNGTNVIFGDKGFNGLIICLKNLNEISIEKDIVCVGAGVNLFRLNTFLCENSFMGLEWSYGIPGSVGGAVCMNAGAYGEEFSNYIVKLEIFDGKKFRVVDKNKLWFSYRDSEVKQNKLVVTKVWLRLQKGEKAVIKQKQKEYLQKRKISQPLEYYNSGSIFKTTNGIIAGKIIDNLGLKGVKIGGAEISTLHANFIINTGSATCDDIKKLIKLVKQKVYDEIGVLLNEEVIFVGDD